MYEHIRRRAPRRIPAAALWAALTVCALVLAAVTGLAVWAGRYQTGYRDFVASLSESTSYAYAHNCLYARRAEGDMRVAQDHIYTIYTMITTAGPGRLGDAPQEAAEVVLDYGDGSRLELWMVDLANSSTGLERGLFLRYTGPDGEVYAYDSDSLTLDRLPLDEWENLPKKLR